MCTSWIFTEKSEGVEYTRAFLAPPLAPAPGPLGIIQMIPSRCPSGLLVYGSIDCHNQTASGGLFGDHQTPLETLGCRGARRVSVFSPVFFSFMVDISFQSVV